MVISQPTSGTRLAGRLDARTLTAVAPALVVAALVIVNAWPGLMPGVGYWDTGEFQTVLPIMGTAHPTGYPTYVLLGFVGSILLTPVGEPAFRVTVLSLLAVATAAGATVVLVRRLTGSMVIGIAVGLGLATTPVVWVNATRADPHAIHLAFVALLLVVLVHWERDRGAEPGRSGAQPGRAVAEPARSDRWLVLAAVVFGLAAGNHSLTLLLAPPIALYVLSVEPAIWRRWRVVLGCIGAAALTTALVYLELPIRGGLLPAPLVYGEPATWDGFWYIALAEQFRGSLSDPFGDLPAKIDELVRLTEEHFGIVGLAIPAALVVAARRTPRYTLLTGSALLITVLFNLSYANADIERYYLGPALWAWTWLGILAAEVAVVVGYLLGELAGRLPGARADDGRERRIATGVAVILGVALLLPTLADLDRRRAEADRSGDVGAARWLDETLPVIPRDAVLVSWWSTSTPLWYAQHVEGRRTDIEVIDDRTMLDLDLGRAPDVIEDNLGVRPVYVIRANERDLGELTARFDMVQVAGSGSSAVYQVRGTLPALP